MRIAVIGAGALGGLFATLLARAGHDLTITAREVARSLIRENGIRLTGGYGDAQCRVLVREILTETPDLTLICTKAQDAAAAIAENAELLDGSPVIVVQNGLDGVRIAQDLLPNSECFGLLTLIAAHYIGPGRVRVTTAASSYLGRGNGKADAATQHWQSVLDEAFPTLAAEDFVGAQWTKLVVNMLNALPAITGLSVQAVIADAPLRRILTESMQETVQVGMARHVTFGSLQGMSDRSLRVFARLPVALGQTLPLRMGAKMGPVANLGSTLQSIKRAHLTEIDHLNGAVVRQAELAGRPAPVNALLTALVHEVEISREFLKPAQVMARFDQLTATSH
ncbi:ketopantoate reductase family protein [Cryobacterium sp. TMS1-13-1]|uniref:ketopantoate reductase family protein n=1 Tax=Cryobacterium sp. TMS1-13-1 TaxID=1259220 RepID=UPI00106D738C|nr:2-dehydropantoate 2-reductase [Cryobacterium sp. TMS1-13-1]TFD23653.1 ketopantoate reductase family protein [Cryobacterium sp. TMS1-13-1]